MAIRPVDVRRKEFKASFRGYDANQVDDFLDAVADEFERSFAENQRLSDEVTNLKSRLEQFEALEDSIRAAIVHAEQAARDLRQNANKEAELILREARDRSHRILAESSDRVERVKKSYEVLNQAKQEFANDFRRLLKSYLSVMDNVDVASAKEIEASLRERLDLESVAAAREAADTQRMEVSDIAAETSPADTQRMERSEIEAEMSSGARSGSGGEARGGEVDDFLGGEDSASGDEDFASGATSGTASGNGGDAGSEYTQRMGPLATPGSGVGVSGGEAGGAGGGAGRPAPEAEESEEDPSSVPESAGRGGATQSVPGAGGGAADEVDREEGIAAGENRAADEFFDEDRTRRREPAEESSEGRGSKIFRASRFLRRRD